MYFVQASYTKPNCSLLRLKDALSDQEQSSIYDQWITTAIENGINGILQYQWSQPNLDPSGGGGVVTSTGGGVTPNDGYGAQSGHVTSFLLNVTLHAD